MKEYQYILFDWDGNLVQTLDIWLECLRMSLEDHGHKLTDKQIGADYPAFKDRMQHLDEQEVDEIIGEALLLAAKKVPDVVLYPDVIATLELYHGRGKRLALVTTSPHAQIDLLLRKYDLGRLFDAVVCGDDVTRLKPNAEPLEKALVLLGGDKEHAIMIGDSDKDIIAATNAGVDSVLFYPARHEVFYDLAELRMLNPTYVIEDFRELVKLVK